MGVQMSVDPDDQIGVPGKVHYPSPLSMRSLKGGTGLEGNSRGNPVMSHGPKGPDKLLIRPVEGGQAGAGSTRDKSLTRHATKAVRHAKSHPAPPGTNPGRPQPSQPVPTCPDSQARGGLGDDRPQVFPQVELRGLEPLTPCLQRRWPRLADLR